MKGVSGEIVFESVTRLLDNVKRNRLQSPPEWDIFMERGVRQLADGSWKPEFVVSKDGEHALYDCIDEIQKNEEIEDNLSVNDLLDMIFDFTRPYLNQEPGYEELNQKRVNKFLSSIEKEMASLAPISVAIPIHNLYFDVGEMTVGKVRLSGLDDVRQRVRASQIGIDDSQTVDQLVREYVDGLVEYEPDLEKVAWAEVEVVASFERAKERAEDEINHALNLLRLCLSSRKTVLHSQFDIEPVKAFGSYTVTYPDISRALPRKTPIPARFDEAALGWFRANHLDKISDALAKKAGERTDLERRVISAAYWFGTGVKSGEDVQRFVNFVTAGESLLLRKSDLLVGLSASLRERMALLLGINYQQRKKIADLVAKLYKVRNRIIHEGQTYVDPGALQSLGRMVSEAIFRVAEMLPKYQSLDALVQAFDKMKLSVPGEVWTDLILGREVET